MAGEGSIYRRADGRWVAQISTGGRLDRRYVRRIGRTRAEAAAALRELAADKRQVTQRRLTVSAYLGRWLRDADSRRHTRVAAERALLELLRGP